MSLIEVTPEIAIDEKDLEFNFVRASGPGGQNVNKVATAVQLRFDVENASLPAQVRERLIRQAGNRISSDGTLIIEARRYRWQERNREDALNRLMELIRQAAKKPRARRKTRPSKAAKERRLQAKRRRSETKRLRKSVDD